MTLTISMSITSVFFSALFFIIFVYFLLSFFFQLGIKHQSRNNNTVTELDDREDKEKLRKKVF